MKKVAPQQTRFVRVLRIVGVCVTILLFALALKMQYAQKKALDLVSEKRKSATAQYMKEATTGDLAMPSDLGRYFTITNNKDGTLSISVRTAENKNFRYSAIPQGSDESGKWDWTFKEITSVK
ncbi:MAG: hypothetical protein ABI615_11695 [Chthoniobacterales bacterium]